MDAIETIKYRGFNINIYQDTDPMNPRTEWDNAGHMVCFHNRYALGDEHHFTAGNLQVEMAMEACPSIEKTIDYWDNEGYQRIASKRGHKAAAEKSEAMVAKIVDKVLGRHYVILPLYFYDHSGITMRTGPFSCPWDSGQVGIIYMTMDEIEHEWPKAEYPDQKKRAREHMQFEVEEYDCYLTGDVYGYEVEPIDANKAIGADDSCWGFYGGKYMQEVIEKEIKPNIDTSIKEYRDRIKAEKAERVKTALFFRFAWAD